MAEDAFSAEILKLTSPLTHPEAVNPNDGQDLDRVTRAIYVGNGGNVRVLMPEGLTTVFENMPAGTFLPLRIKRVFATGTTASGIIGLS